MIQNEIIPGFDCVESKRKVQAKIYEETRNLSPEEEIRYFEDHALSGPLNELWRALETKQASRPIPRSGR